MKWLPLNVDPEHRIGRRLRRRFAACHRLIVALPARSVIVGVIDRERERDRGEDLPKKVSFHSVLKVSKGLT